MRPARTWTRLATALAAAVMAVTVGEGALAPRRAEAGHGWRSVHWFRAAGERTIHLDVRNQIGELATPYIHDVIAKWGSVRARSWLRPVRTDFGFLYNFGGPPACQQFVPRRIIFCAAHHSDAHVSSDGHVGGAIVHIAVPHLLHQGTYCQEFGHALGLHHRRVGASCMRSTRFRTPDQHDLDLSRDRSAHFH